MNQKFFTNQDENTLLHKFEGMLENNPTINCFDAVVGFFRASGYFQVKPFLGKINKIRILVGIEADKLIAQAAQKGILFFGDNELSKDEFLASVKKDINDSDYSKPVEDGILQLIDDIIQKRVEIRAHPSRKIHAKIYLLYPDNFNQHTLNAAAITGSSNLTGNGLGISNDRQYEFNVLLNDNDEVAFAKSEFETLWEEAKGTEITADDIQKTKSETYLVGDVTPYELYIKTLIEYFGDSIDYSIENNFDLPANFRRMEYQMDAVLDGYRKLIKYDGFFLSDVVGLGKTVIATMIAKKFLIENGISNTKILVVYPPAVEKNWKNTFAQFDIDKFTKFITNGSLSKILDTDNYNYWNAEEYDLILIDESHKFRNHTTGMFSEMQEICKYPRINKGKIEGTKKKVMLISATPLNNTPEDLYNQILLFQNPRRSTLPGVSNLTAFFAPRTKQFKELRAEKKLNVNALLKLYEEIREKVLKPITVRRTRTDIEAISRYKADVEDFPKIKKPDKLEYVLDEALSKLFDYTVKMLIDKTDGLKYSRYQAIAALLPSIQDELYEQAERVSKSLAFIMKNLLVKRLESSFEAFRTTLNRFRVANERMIEMFKKGNIYIAPDLDINKLYEKGFTIEEIEAKINEAKETDPKNQIFKPEDFKPEFIDELLADQKILEKLVSHWNKIDHDPKLEVFLDKLQSEFFDNTRNVGQKLVIFSESTDTVEYLKKNINRKDVLCISADNRNKMFETIQANFDANYDKNKQQNDFNIILTTEVLAEGVNLHRSNIIINYDTPWNSTKLMQRIGRINRIGSVAKELYNYVFYPSAKGNKELKLINNSLAKIQAFHTAFGEDNQIYSTDEIVDLNLDKLFEEGLPPEEINKELQYLELLREFRKRNPIEFKRIEKLSLRSRSGREARQVNDKMLANGSLVFLKTQQLNSFYYVTDTSSEELSTLQALDFFKAEKEEKRIARIEQHHTQVDKAKQSFIANLQAAITQQERVVAAGRQVTSAMAFVRRHLGMTEDGETRRLLNQLIKLIEWGTISSLAAELNRMEKQVTKNKNKREEIYLRIVTMAKRYNIYFMEDVSANKVDIPCIILSESFN